MKHSLADFQAKHGSTLMSFLPGQLLMVGSY